MSQNLNSTYKKNLLFAVCRYKKFNIFFIYKKEKNLEYYIKNPHFGTSFRIAHIERSTFLITSMHKRSNIVTVHC